MILQGTPLSSSRFGASVRSLYAQLPDGAGAVIEAHEAAGTTADPAYLKALRVFMRKHLSRTPVKHIAMPYMAPTPEGRGDALALAMTGGRLGEFGGALVGFDDEPLLSRISVPTLLLSGEYDIVTPAMNRALLPRLRRGRQQVLADAGHMAQFDQPEAWRLALRSFLTDSEA